MFEIIIKNNLPVQIPKSNPFFCSALLLQEFEVIAQIKLLQLASNNYNFTQDSHFREWFAGVDKYSEAERSVIRGSSPEESRKSGCCFDGGWISAVIL